MVYNLIETATGKNVSQSSTAIPSPKEGFHVVETADNVGVWNEATLVFDPSPVSKRYMKEDFYKNVGLVQFNKVVVAAETDVEVKALLMYLSGLKTVDLEDAELVYGIGLLVTKGVWTQAEADTVTA